MLHRRWRISSTANVAVGGAPADELIAVAVAASRGWFGLAASRATAAAPGWRLLCDGSCSATSCSRQLPHTARLPLVGSCCAMPPAEPPIFVLSPLFFPFDLNLNLSCYCYCGLFGSDAL